MATDTNDRSKYRREFEDPAQTMRDMQFSRAPMWRAMKDAEFSKGLLAAKLAYLQDLTLQELAGEV